MNDFLIGTQWKVKYDLPYSKPIIFKFIDSHTVLTDAGTQFNWKSISPSEVRIFIPNYICLYAFLANSIITHGHAYSDYSGMDWNWNCEQFFSDPDPVISPISKNDLIDNIWVIKNANGLEDNEITILSNGVITSSLYGTGKWVILSVDEEDELSIITAHGFITYKFKIVNGVWIGRARNEMGDIWDSTFCFKNISPSKLIARQAKLNNLYLVKKKDAYLISKHLNDIGITCFFHFTDRSNLQSIIDNGGLYSWSYCSTNGIVITRPGGDELSRQLDRRFSLHDYVRLSFCKEHPMKYVCLKSKRIITPATLEIDTSVAEFEHTLFSDINAADSSHRKGGSFEFLKSIDYSIFMRNYFDLSPNEKKKYQSEILVKTWIPVKYILNLKSQ